MVMPVPCPPNERVLPVRLVLSPSTDDFAPANDNCEGKSKILREQILSRCRNGAVPYRWSDR
ncbi:hypothetical protein MLPM_1001 [Mycobacterium lepromatosis]|uniref:Uncharacterized protein n=1 Tax=Mycobacterium lepromatosis TaxID=480418 RepID=A0A0F4EQY5_9MYCO|nr:hypothetical protein MLPM_1001 [Mycobacterium lepromatosis]